MSLVLNNRAQVHKTDLKYYGANDDRAVNKQNYADKNLTELRLMELAKHNSRNVLK